jgi:mono/diheme cytochrome c family protein
MTLNPGRPGISIDATGASRETGARTGPDKAAGQRLYSQVCIACHGPDGNMIADRRLKGLGARLDLAATIAYIKDPKPPMPKLYPGLLDEKSIADVAAYIHEDLR